jgi:hypothetical protein
MKQALPLSSFAFATATLVLFCIYEPKLSQSARLHSEAMAFADKTIGELGTASQEDAPVIRGLLAEIKELREKIASLELFKCSCKQPAQEAAAAEPWSVTMYTSDSCPPCKQWLSTEKDKVTRAGWKFTPIKDLAGPWPRFVLKFRGKTVEHVGYLDMTTMKRIVEE